MNKLYAIHVTKYRSKNGNTNRYFRFFLATVRDNPLFIQMIDVTWELRARTNYRWSDKYEALIAPSLNDVLSHPLIKSWMEQENIQWERGL